MIKLYPALVMMVSGGDGDTDAGGLRKAPATTPARDGRHATIPAR